MVDLFPTAMGFFWRPENDGQGFHDSPHDPGGATSWGVTFASWQAWQVQHKAPVPTIAQFAALPKETFLPLYRANYWNATRCGNLGSIGVQVFDIAANAGPGNAAKFLQTVLRIDVDGELGPETVMRVNQADPQMLNVALCARREAFYASLPTAEYFGRGWDRRAEDCRAYVSALLAGKH